MPFAEHFMLSGKISAPATLPGSLSINCGFLPTKVQIINETQWGQTGTGNLNIQEIKWDSTNPTQTNSLYINAAGTALLPSALTSNGISLYNGAGASPQQLSLGPKITGSTYAKATGRFTVSSTASLYAGATVLMTGFTVDKQLGGMLFTVNSIVSSTVFDIANSGNWLNTASFTGGAQTFYVQLVTVPSLYYPQNSQIVYISAANPAVITTSTNMGLTVGQQVRLYVPKAFGMTQANSQTAIISAVSGNQITLGGSISLDSSAFTAFSWPAATGVPYTPATIVPIGSGPTPTTFLPSTQYYYDTVDDAMNNQAFQGFIIGPSLLQTAAAGTVGVTASDVLSWTAWRGDV